MASNALASSRPLNGITAYTSTTAPPPGTGSNNNSSSISGNGGGSNVATLSPAIIYTVLMMLMGCCGNTVVCYVYGYRWKSSTVTKIFIFSLAALDLTNSVVCMPTEIALLVHIVSFDAPVWCKLTRFLTYTLNGASSLILVSISMHRWFKVCYRPLEDVFTVRRTKVTCASSVLVAAVLSSPSLVLYGNLTVPILGSPGRMGVTCLVSDDYIDTDWPFLFYCVYFVCYLGLVVALVLLYTLIAVRLNELKRKRKARGQRVQALNGMAAGAGAAVAAAGAGGDDSGAVDVNSSSLDESVLKLRPQGSTDLHDRFRCQTTVCSMARSSASLAAAAGDVAGWSGNVRCSDVAGDGGGGGGDGGGGGCRVQIHVVDEETALVQDEGSFNNPAAPFDVDVVVVHPQDRQPLAEVETTDGEEKARNVEDLPSDAADCQHREHRQSRNPQPSTAASTNKVVQFRDDNATAALDENPPATTTTTTTTAAAATSTTSAEAAPASAPAEALRALNSRQLTRLSSQSQSSSNTHGEGDEQGIHFASQSDIQWQHNPLVIEEEVPFADSDAVENDRVDEKEGNPEGKEDRSVVEDIAATSDVGSSRPDRGVQKENGDGHSRARSHGDSGDDGTNTSVAQEELSVKVQDDEGDSSSGVDVVVGSNVDLRDRSEPGDAAIISTHVTTATSTATATLTPTPTTTSSPSHDKAHLNSTDLLDSSEMPLLKPPDDDEVSRSSSFLMPPGGYPGGRTPTSRLPSPIGTPVRAGSCPRPVTGKQLARSIKKSGLQYRTRKTTRMFFVISLVFVISFLPFFCIVLVRCVNGKDFLASLSSASVVLVSIFIRSSFLSNAFNPIIYGLCNKDFRKECRLLLARFYKQRRDSRDIVMNRALERTDDMLDGGGS